MVLAQRVASRREAERGIEADAAMAFPRTFGEMKERGYRFEDHARCRSCGQEIEWWTTPNGKRVPMNLMEPKSSSPAVGHQSTCSGDRAPLTLWGV